MPMAMDTRPMKRSCPSESSVALRKVSRHNAGAANGIAPSRIRSSAKAAHSESKASPGRVQRRYLAGARGGVRPPPDLLKYWKNSPEGSSTITSLRPRNVAL